QNATEGRGCHLRWDEPPRACVSGKATDNRRSPGCEGLLASCLPYDFVMQRDYAVLKRLRGNQLQRHRTMPRRQQGDALADERGDHAEVKLVDLVYIEE